MRQTFLPFALPDTNEDEINEVAEAIRSGWVTTGPKTRQFEAEFAQAVGAKYAVAVNSCTAAMHLALEASGLQAGDAVMTTPYTFAATAEVIRYFNATPVFVDIEPDTLNIDPARVAETIEKMSHSSFVIRHSSLVKALIPVHIAGLPAELDALGAIAAQHNLALIEDAAHAFPAAYQGRIIGSAIRGRESENGRNRDSRGAGSREQETNDQRQMTSDQGQMPNAQFVCFSFYATKTITTGEGGMLCTGDETLAERCRMMALHGISKDAWKRYTAEGSWYYEIVAPGFKYNMTDIAAAMGLAQLRKAERMWQRRRQIARLYNEALGAMPELQIPADRAGCQHAWHLYMLRLHLERLEIDRGQFITALKSRNIGTSVHFIPLHLHPYYKETYGYRPEDFPVATREYQRVISLPIYSKMSDQDVQDVIEAVQAVVQRHRCRSFAGYTAPTGD